MFGELMPYGGGDPIPLVKTNLLVGRRESCDIVLRFANVSAHHCELTLEQGYWFVRDLNSRNGTKVNGLRVTAKKRVDPGDRLSIAKHHWEVRYSPADLGAEGPPPDETALSEILGQSLMKSAGLERRDDQQRAGRIGARRGAAASQLDDLFDDLDLDEDEDEKAAEGADRDDGGEPADAPAEAAAEEPARPDEPDDEARDDSGGTTDR